MSTQFDPIIGFIKQLYKTEGEIHLHQPSFGPTEEENLLVCLRTTNVASTGDFIHEFEDKILTYTGAKFAVAMVNGTSALHLALHCLGIGKNDLVITQALTFTATKNAILYCGAEPLYIDIEEVQLGISPELLEVWLDRYAKEGSDGAYYHKENGRRIAACVPVHTFGFPSRIKELAEICEAYNIPLVEDAAEALGSFINTQHCGTFGRAGILSFNGNKVITSGGGGMVLTSDEALAKKLRHLSTQAKQIHPWEFLHDLTGYNYRLPNLNAALGSAQMDGLAAKLESKKRISNSYQNFFKNRPEHFLSAPENVVWNGWLNAILFKNIIERDQFIQYAHQKEVYVRPAWRPVHLNEPRNESDDLRLPVTMDIYHRLVNLPSSALEESHNDDTENSDS